MLSSNRYSYKERKAIASRRIRRVVFSFIFFALYLVFSVQLSTPLKITSSSMEPALTPGDRIFYSKILIEAQQRFDGWENFGISRGDLVVISPPYYRENQAILDLINPMVRFFTFQRVQFSSWSRRDWEQSLLIKRVVALPGDSIMMADHRLYIRAEGAIDYRPEQEVIEKRYTVTPYDFPELWRKGYPLDGNLEEYTLKEDEYFVLSDARGQGSDSYLWGPLPKEKILGKVFFRYWPFRTFSLL